MTTNGSHDEPYWLGRASEEQKRLLKQHGIWTKSIGYSLHPSIAANLPSNARIADVATGTGIWLKDLASVSPSTQTFHGYDISSEQYLPATSLPPNVSLDLLDIKKPIPTALQGTFDLVNVRLVIIAMGSLDVWQSTLANLITMLKPGGCITWTDGNFLHARGFRGADDKSTPGHALTTGLMQMNNTLVQRFGYSFPDLGRLFRDAGLCGVREDVVKARVYRDFDRRAVGGVGEFEQGWGRGVLGRGRGGEVEGGGREGYGEWGVYEVGYSCLCWV
ncbi:S-adenosyl-L-methionine-dependent methyltransferase [Ampelomyces quisqualis]|uniref:S-adenosyl-L-methionine-dependent methyltransferase n=1 Tax=Ampelomyces quisqualis TaxID=50730 RepID=A0A6A5QFY3_AMPQU|nr:S-adenosyl-L-methionine-dependent methyltransferase [Ampelomyces quisqualis]